MMMTTLTYPIASLRNRGPGLAGSLCLLEYCQTAPRLFLMISKAPYKPIETYLQSRGMVYRTQKNMREMR